MYGSCTSPAFRHALMGRRGPWPLIQQMPTSRYLSTTLRCTVHPQNPQHDAHTSALKLQRQSLEVVMAIERAQALQHEDIVAQAELVTLRTHPDSMPTQPNYNSPSFPSLCGRERQTCLCGGSVSAVNMSQHSPYTRGRRSHD